MTEKKKWYRERIIGSIALVVLALLAFTVLPHLVPCLNEFWQKWRPADKFTFGAKVYPWYLLGLAYCLYENREYPASPWQAYFFSLQIRGVIATILISSIIGGGSIRLGMTLGDAYGIAAAVAFLYGWKKYLPDPKNLKLEL